MSGHRLSKLATDVGGEALQEQQHLDHRRCSLLFARLFRTSSALIPPCACYPNLGIGTWNLRSGAARDQSWRTRLQGSGALRDGLDAPVPHSTKRPMIIPILSPSNAPRYIQRQGSLYRLSQEECGCLRVGIDRVSYVSSSGSVEQTPSTHAYRMPFRRVRSALTALTDNVILISYSAAGTDGELPEKAVPRPLARRRPAGRRRPP